MGINEALHKLLIGLYSNPFEIGISMKLVRLIKMCLNETYSRVRAAKCLSDTFPLKNEKRERFIAIDVSSALDYAIKRDQADQEGLKLNATYEALIYAEDVKIFGGSIYNIQMNTKTLVVANKEIGLEVSAETSKYMIRYREHQAGKTYHMLIGNNSLERVEQLKYVGKTLRNQNFIMN
jgi:hypothetical protein